LDNSDIGEFRDRQPIDVSLIELLEVSNISVFQNSEILNCLVKFPSSKVVCKKITVYPDQHQNKILNFKDGNLVIDLNIGYCKKTVGATFCKELQNGTCAQHCSTLPGHLDPVTIVDQGTLIVNDANVTITDEQRRDQKVVTYSDKVALNGTWFVNS